jgi:HAMP domain-containing protein
MSALGSRSRGMWQGANAGRRLEFPQLDRVGAPPEELVNGPSRPLPQAQESADRADRPRGRLPRVPLPAKLLLSYLLLLAIVAVPNFVYVRARLGGNLVEEARGQLLAVAQRTATLLGPLPAGERLARVHDLARMSGDRVTLVAASGDVVYDSQVADPAALQSHRDRPEIQSAAAFGTGTARRASETTGHDTLYAAARLPVALGVGAEGAAGVVRIARPLSTLRTSTDELTSFARNIQAAAISVALLLSLVAAIQFLRPLQRVIAAAKALGAGDLAARSDVASDDEVGDAGRAIDAMALEIRRRLANAGSGDAVLAQLVDALPVPCVVFEVTGEVLALNGAARAAFRIEGKHASRRLKELTASARFEEALDAAEGDGEPEPLDVEVAGDVRVRSTIHVLKRPGVAPLYVLLGGGAAPTDATTLPPFEAVRPRSFAEVLDEARSDALASMSEAGVGLEVAEAPSVMVVDVGHRVPRAIAECMRAGALSVEGRAETLALDVKVEETQVTIALETGLGPDAVARIGPLLEPLGGGVEVDGQRTTMLWIPRA